MNKEKIPFDIEIWRKNKHLIIVTRDGDLVKRLQEVENPVTDYVLYGEVEGEVFTWKRSGTYAVKGAETSFDLFFSPNQNMEIELLNEKIQKLTEEQRMLISDGYHTFNVLYDFRAIYNAALFNEWAKQEKYNVHKSWRHHDGELCFGGGYFIVTAQLPDGQISNHYKADRWDSFDVPETEKALFPFDGHTAQDVLNRLSNLIDNA